MRCSSDLRKRVLVCVRGGGSKAEAARRFQVSRASVYNWLNAPDGLAYRGPSGASPPPGLGGVAGPREAGAGSDPKRVGPPLWGVPALHLACPAADGRDSKKKRWGTPSAAPGKERRICACVSAMSAVVRSLSTSMKVALTLRLSGATRMPGRGSGCTA